jgi:hypothetical protein
VLRSILLVAALGLTLLCGATPAQAVVDFKTPRNAAYCSADEVTGNRFLCWTPNDGFTVGMKTNGRVKKLYSRANRGYRDRYFGRVLRYGQSGRFGARRQFRCTSHASGLTCLNRAGHGWWLGIFRGYRIF